MTEQHPLKQYLPLLGAVFVVVLQSVYSSLADDVLSTVEILNIVIALTAALTTYVIPRLEGGLAAWAKPAVSAIAAGVMVLVDALSGSAGSITSATWVMALIQLVLGSGLVLLTQSNVPLTVAAPTPDAVAVSPGVAEVRRDEDGAIDNGILITIAAIVVIVCGIIWLIGR